MRFELTTPTLARLCSTPELRPLLPRSTAARRIWRKAKLNARQIPAYRHGGLMPMRGSRPNSPGRPQSAIVYRRAFR